MNKHDPELEIPAGWYATGFTSPQGDLAMAWKVLLPVGFVDKLENDIDALGRELIEEAYAEGVKVIEYSRIDVQGRPAFERIVSWPLKAEGAIIPDATIVGAITIPITNDEAIELTVTCGNLGYNPTTASSHTIGQTPTESSQETAPTKKTVGPAASAKIAHDILTGIRSGRLPRGSRLPGRFALLHDYSTDKKTVDAAIRTLQDEGYIHVVPGRGTYVSENGSGTIDVR
jgi:Bacterial regulatory proteins, gntR family